MQRKTLTERLTDKHQLIIRSEENFADKWIITFNYAKLMVVTLLLLLITYVVFTSVNSFIAYLAGTNNELEQDKKVIALAAKIDSLQYEAEQKDRYILSFKNILNGGVSKVSDVPVKSGMKNSGKEEDNADVEFRKKFEKSGVNTNYIAQEGFTKLYFTSPFKGEVVEHYNPTEGKYNVEIQSVKKGPVKAIEDGVLLQLERADGLRFYMVVQHVSGLVTTYNNVVIPLKKPGDHISKGEIICGPENDKVSFAMWYNSKPLDPEKYVAF